MSFILGIDLAGGKVLFNPAVPLSEHPHELKQKYPEVFLVHRSCTVGEAKAGFA